ncbi:MAG TPA: helix-turn-helix domain-containing protein [Polyangiales bacterium]|nr:helix-turn-helix domain-containing protein [Polyangiales bacterium]
MYLEHAIDPTLRDVAVCTWQHSSVEASRSRVVPDACVDILWDGARLMLAGPDTRAVEVAMAAGTQVLGLRFAPGAAGALLGVPASAVRDARVPLQELWGDNALLLEASLHDAQEPRAALRLMEDMLRERVAVSTAVDRVALAVANALQPSLELAGSPQPRLQRDSLAGLQVQRAGALPLSAASARLGSSVPSVAQLAAALGVSERQLLRRCDAAFGYGPKLLARVLRFQAFVRALRVHPQLGLAELALELGYTDQAHLAHDTSELAGQTPTQLRARWSE